MSTSGLPTHAHHTLHTHYRLTHVYTIYTSHTHTHIPTHIYADHTLSCILHPTHTLTCIPHTYHTHT